MTTSPVSEYRGSTRHAYVSLANSTAMPGRHRPLTRASLVRYFLNCMNEFYNLDRKVSLYNRLIDVINGADCRLIWRDETGRYSGPLPKKETINSTELQPLFEGCPEEISEGSDSEEDRNVKSKNNKEAVEDNAVHKFSPVGDDDVDDPELYEPIKVKRFDSIEMQRIYEILKTHDGAVDCCLFECLSPDNIGEALLMGIDKQNEIFVRSLLVNYNNQIPVSFRSEALVMISRKVAENEGLAQELFSLLLPEKTRIIPTSEEDSLEVAVFVDHFKDALDYTNSQPRIHHQLIRYLNSGDINWSELESSLPLSVSRVSLRVGSLNQNASPNSAISSSHPELPLSNSEKNSRKGCGCSCSCSCS